MLKTTRNTIISGAIYVIIKLSIVLLAGGAFYKSRYWSNWYFIVLPALGLCTLIIRRIIRNKQKNYVDN